MTRLRILLLTLAFAAPVLAQQASGDGYHRAAQLFIDGDTEQADAVASEALQAAPDDAKLQALLDLIRQQQPPQDGSGGNQNEEGENQPDEPDDQGESGSQGQQQERPPDERQEAEQDQTRADPNEGEGGEPNESPSEGARPGEGGETPQGEMPSQPGRMSREQAAQILEAVGGEERLLLRELRRRPSRMRRSDKDW